MDHKTWQNWWVKQAETYFTDKVWQFSQPALIERLGIEKHHRVLEIGFGYGRELAGFCKLSDNVFGLELADWTCRATLEELKGRGVKPLPILIAYDGSNIPFFPNTFDVIYSCFVVQHLSREHAKELIRETLRVLKPEGQALFEFFGDPAYYDGGRDVLNEGEHGPMFNNAYRETEIPLIIGACGGKLRWQIHAPVAKEWGNHWVCFGKADRQTERQDIKGERYVSEN